MVQEETNHAFYVLVLCCILIAGLLLIVYTSVGAAVREDEARHQL